MDRQEPEFSDNEVELDGVRWLQRLVQLSIVTDQTCKVKVQIGSIGVEFESRFDPLQIVDTVAMEVEQLANSCKFFWVPSYDVDPEKLPAGQAWEGGP